MVPRCEKFLTCLQGFDGQPKIKETENHKKTVISDETKNENAFYVCGGRVIVFP